MKKMNPAAAMLILLAVLAVVTVAAALIGAVPASPLDHSLASDMIFWQLRLPRVLLALLTGAMLAVSGAVLQSLLRNPLCDPFILGVSSGGGLGAALAIVLGLPAVFIPVTAFVFALFSVASVYNLARVGGQINPATLILSGVAVSSFLSSAITFLTVAGSKLEPIYYWMLGSFSHATWTSVYISLACAIIGILLVYTFSGDLNIILFGEEQAGTLGVDIKVVTFVVLCATSLMSGVSVAFCGMIGFVGLVVPHIVRIFSGADNHNIIPLSALSGAAFMVLADLLSRTLLAPSELPVGVITALIGAPFFIYLLRRNK